MLFRYCFFVLLVTSGCMTHQYTPSPAYVPNHTKKLELKGTATLSSIQLSFTPTDQLFVMASGYLRDAHPYEAKEGSGDPSGYESVQEFSLGLGYYKKFNRLNVELLAGAGTGKLDYQNKYSGSLGYSFHILADRQNYFIQPDISYTNSNIEFAAFTRVNWVRLTDMTTAVNLYSTPEIKPVDKFFYGKNQVTMCFIEPGVTIKAGGKNFKGFASLSKNISLNDFMLSYRDTNFILGCQFAIEFGRNKSSKD